MAVALFLLPSGVFPRLEKALKPLIDAKDVELFSPGAMGVAAVFTPAERAAFKADGAPIAIAAADGDAFRSATPERTDGALNYIEIQDERVLARLDPYRRG